MPNRHRLLVNLQPFGRENANDVFVATDEPHGVISGTVRRSVDPGSTGGSGAQPPRTAIAQIVKKLLRTRASRSVSSYTLNRAVM